MSTDTKTPKFSEKAIENVKNAIAAQHARKANLEYRTIIAAIILEKFPDLLPTYLNDTDIIIPNESY